MRLCPAASMTEAGDILRNVNVVAFCLLALACGHQWLKRRDASIRWATLGFGSLALISVIGAILRESPTTHMAGWFVKAILVVLVVFPFFLYRFATAFQRPSRLLAGIAHGSTLLVVAATLWLPDLPRPGKPPPTWWTAYRVGILFQWTILFSVVAARLWVSARRETTVVRKRMRTLALAAAGLNGAILLSGVGASARTEGMIVLTQGLSLLSAVLFFIGLAPPALLVQMWRRPEQLALQEAMGPLFQAEEQAELSAVLLPRAVGIVGARGAALVDHSGSILASHGDIEPELEALRADSTLADAAQSGVHRLELRSGTLLLWTSHYAPFFGRDEFALTKSLGVFADIVLDRCALAERQREAEVALTYQATHDTLTGLPNRVLLESRLTDALARSRRTGTPVAVLFLDVDRFKVINDSLGHAFGDQLLCALAERLTSHVRPEDTIARFGGDEFVVVAERWGPEDAPTALAARIAAALEAPLCIGSTSLVATASIGLAVAAPHCDAGSLLRDADAAMYQAKAQGRDRWVVFDWAMREAADRRLATETALRKALSTGGLQVHYQPTVEIVSGELAGVEALVRWEKDADTLILPRDFIPVAEETGLIIQLGAHVLQQACRQVAVWQREVPGLEHLTLSVNLSARELLNPGIVDQVGEAVRASGIDPFLLCLEITESVLLDDAQSCVRSLQALHALGVRVAVDDFGTGYSSLTYLKRLAVDTLKIDQSFVAGLGSGASKHDRAIVAGVVDLAHAFGLTTVAEGVETAEQVAHLKAIGCQLAQGYHFCRPLPAEAALEWMRSRQALTAASTPPAQESELPTTTRVLVIDDQASMRGLLQLTLEFEEDFSVVGEAAGGREGVALARHFQPDVVLLDLAMPGVGGLEALPLIRAVAPGARVVVVSALDPDDLAVQAIDEGAVGYLCKGGDATRFVTDLRRLLEADALLEV